MLNRQLQEQLAQAAYRQQRLAEKLQIAWAREEFHENFQNPQMQIANLRDCQKTAGQQRAVYHSDEEQSTPLTSMQSSTPVEAFLSLLPFVATADAATLDELLSLPDVSSINDYQEALDILNVQTKGDDEVNSGDVSPQP